MAFCAPRLTGCLSLNPPGRLATRAKPRCECNTDLRDGKMPCFRAALVQREFADLIARSVSASRQKILQFSFL